MSETSSRRRRALAASFYYRLALNDVVKFRPPLLRAPFTEPLPRTREVP